MLSLSQFLNNFSITSIGKRTRIYISITRNHIILWISALQKNIEYQRTPMFILCSLMHAFKALNTLNNSSVEWNTFESFLWTKFSTNSEVCDLSTIDFVHKTAEIAIIQEFSSSNIRLIIKLFLNFLEIALSFSPSISMFSLVNCLCVFLILFFIDDEKI